MSLDNQYVRNTPTEARNIIEIYKINNPPFSLWQKACRRRDHSQKIPR